jgi:hypothetical protein
MSETRPIFNIGDRVYDSLYRVEGTITASQEHKQHIYLYKHTGHKRGIDWSRQDTLAPSGCLVGREIEYDG